MTYYVRQSGAWVAKTAMQVKQSGAFVNKTTGYKRVGGSWVGFLSSGLSAYNSAGDILDARSDAGVLSGNAVIVASGGTGSYTYSTSWISGGSGITITGGTTSTPGATATSAPSDGRSGVLRCVVSDGVSSVNVDFNVTFNWL